jgi:hypothetical protein
MPSKDSLLSKTSIRPINYLDLTAAANFKSSPALHLSPFSHLFQLNTTKPTIIKQQLLQPLKPLLRKSNIYNATRSRVKTKSVQFDIPLVQVIHFHAYPMDEGDYANEEINGKDNPEDPEDPEDEDDEYIEEEEENMLEDAFLDGFLNNTLQEYRISQAKSRSIVQQKKPSSLRAKSAPRRENETSLVLPNWPPALASQRCLCQMVSLESLVWDSVRSVVLGSILAQNIAFEKQVIARYTFDAWKTWDDIQASYKEVASFNDQSDTYTLNRYEFELSLSLSELEKTSLPQLKCCSMVVLYQTDDSIFWDTNKEKTICYSQLLCLRVGHKQEI